MQQIKNITARLAGAAVLGALALAGCNVGSIGPGTATPTPTPGGTPPPTDNTNRIVFASQRAQAFPTEDVYFNIFTINPDGSDVRQLTDTQVGEREPAWSRDRSRIAFIRQSQLWIMNADGSNQRKVTDQSARVPSFSPDGQSIAFAGGDNEGYGGIYVVNVDGSGLRRLTNSGSNPSWSVNNVIAFDGSVREAITGTATAGTQPRFLTYPNTVLFIWSIKPDGSDLTQLTDGNNEARPEYSRDGSLIVYNRRENGQSPAYIMNADGANQRLVATGSKQNPVFSPDATQIAYHTTGIGIIDVDGSNDRGLTNTPGALSIDPAWG